MVGRRGWGVCVFGGVGREEGGFGGLIDGLIRGDVRS